MSLARNIAAALFRGHRTIVVDGVRYRERSTEPLHRSLSERGPGHKDYDALFPGSAPMRIRCTAERQYADIVGERLLDPYRLADRIARPGMRVLDARCRTGYGAAHLARLVGPSGGVVALDPDHESIRYARRRYPEGNVSFEIGGVESIEGELDGSFDMVVAVNLLRSSGAMRKACEALWRVLAPGGPMLLVQPLPPEGRSVMPEPGGEDEPLRLTTAELGGALRSLEPEPGIEPADTLDLAAVVARRPRPAKPPGTGTEGRTYPPMR